MIDVVMDETCRLAIIGGGNMAREHIRAFADVPGVAISGIHSRTRARAEALASEFGVALVCDSVAELYERTEAHLVVATVPPTAMNEISKACFRYPWTVLMEKPSGYNVPDAQQIQAAATVRNRTVLVGLNRRFLSSTRAALADLASREGPRFIKVQDQEDQIEAKAAGHPDLVVRNWMYANSIHVIDYFRIFGRGQITTIKPVFAWNPHDPRVVIAKIEFDSGDTGLYEGIWSGPGPWAVSVTMPAKRWELRPLEQAAFQNKGERGIQPVEIHPWDRAFKPGFRLQAEMAVAAALGQPSDSPTLAEAMETMLLIEKIFESRVIRQAPS